MLLTGSGGFGAVPVVDAVLAVGSWRGRAGIPVAAHEQVPDARDGEHDHQRGDDDRGHHPQLRSRLGVPELSFWRAWSSAMRWRGAGVAASPWSGEPFLEPADRAALPDRHDDQAHRGEEREDGG